MSAPEILILSVEPGRGSGAERVLLYLLAGGNSSLRSSVVIAAPPDSLVRKEAEILGYRTLSWTAARDSFPANLMGSLRFLLHRADSDPSLVHAWGARALEWAWLIARSKGRPVTGTLHDPSDGPMHGRARRLLSRTILPHFDALAAISRATAASWQPYASRPIVPIHNGLPDISPLPRRTNGPWLEVGFLGSYALWKGIAALPFLIEATEKWPLRWHLYGEADAQTRPIVQKILARFPERASYHGHCAPEEIYSRIDLLLHASLELDPATVILEAARAGIPLLASNVAGTSETVRDGETGFLFSTSNLSGAVAHLRRLATDRAEVLRLGRNNRRLYEEKFKVDRMVSAYHHFWSSALVPCPPSKSKQA